MKILRLLQQKSADHGNKSWSPIKSKAPTTLDHPEVTN